MELVEFSNELAAHSFNVAVVENVMPDWITRLGTSEGPVIDLCNEKVGALVGVRIEAGGTVTRTE